MVERKLKGCVSDRGFSVISKGSATNPAAQGRYADVRSGELPPGFLAMDLAAAPGMSAFDPEARFAPVAPGAHRSWGNALLGDFSGATDA